ncbi:alpha/beta fold hydrolase [Metabacillus fastidiosus]|uniref:Alpha/beta hydrolase n=1 Tax=Metabacillus fastidiosus TaxID=1458 RepID=A0ABU6NTD2_9BACI|nr:alpha/beta hydrolase [Metabacillus fastidiosus]
MPYITLRNNETIFYDEYGSGTPVLFIHPPGMGRKVFFYQKSLKKYMRLIIPDLSGHGDSSFINTNEVSVKTYAEEIIMLMDELSLKEVVLYGYSAGGMIAQYICSYYKERVKGLILSGGYPAVLNLSFQFEHKLGMYFAANHRRILTNVLAISHTRNKKLRKTLKIHMDKAHTKAWYSYYNSALCTNLIKNVSSFQMPVLLIYGDKADMINKYVRIYRKLLNNNVRAVFIKGVGHQHVTKKWKQENYFIYQFLNKLKG